MSTRWPCCYSIDASPEVGMRINLTPTLLMYISAACAARWTEGHEPLIRTLRGIGYVLKDANPVMHSAAWRISLWATLAFAIGTMLVFAMLHRFVANDIQRRSDAWLLEVAVLGDVAGRTPKDRLYGRVVREVAELQAERCLINLLQQQ